MGDKGRNGQRNERRRETNAYLVSTIPARLCRVIDQIPDPPRVAKKLSHILPTGLSCRRAKVIQLLRLAHDVTALQFRDHHTADEAREWVQLIQPGAPEAGHLRVGNRDAAEEREGYDYKGVEEGGDDWFVR